MVGEIKIAGRDESLRMDQLAHKVEVAQVFRVWTHNDPEDKNWQVCDVIIQDSVPLNGSTVGVDGPAVRLRVPVRQDTIGNRSGTPHSPRVGDSVLIGFYMNDRPIILGVLPPQYVVPVCRSSSNPGQLPDGAHEDWTEGDFHNYYDRRIKLVQWLHIPRRTIVDDQGRTWYTTFDHSKVDPTGKLRPVCFNYFDKTRDVMAVFECKKGKAEPDCKLCELNGDGSGEGPDHIKCENEPCSGTLPAMNTWLKILSSDYEGSYDIARRFKLHWSCGSLFCTDSKCGNDEGRIWLEAMKAHVHRAHIHFRAQGTSVGANLSLRSDYTNAAHIELYGVGDPLKGKILIKNCDIGNYIDVMETDEVKVHAALIDLEGNVEITGNLVIDGSISHGADLSCDSAGGAVISSTGTGAQQTIAHGVQNNLAQPCRPGCVTPVCSGGTCTINSCDQTNIYVTCTGGIPFKVICTAPEDGWGDWKPCF
jgi:hypothetical protein